jgi:type III pantothenate kinase
MTPDVVVDIGNTRIKWGRCSPDAVVVAVSLAPDDENAWNRQAEAWNLQSPMSWAIAGVQPAWRDRLLAWVNQRGDVATILADWRDLPLVVRVPKPEGVGIDRLLDAVAVNALRTPGRPAVVIDAGSAVTVDWIDEAGAFAGGAILPGFGLMARCLHDYTALLPLIEVPKQMPPVPGKATASAIEAGIFWSVAGGVWGLVAAYGRQFDASPEVFLTGGDSALIASTPLGTGRLCPLLTLNGVQLAAKGRRN